MENELNRRLNVAYQILESINNISQISEPCTCLVLINKKESSVILFVQKNIEDNILDIQ